MRYGDDTTPETSMRKVRFLMILQIGAFFGSLATGLGQIAKEVGPALLSTGLDIGKQFLQRELARKEQRRQKDLLKASAVQALNSPGISVATIGGARQPVGGQVQRSTFVPAAQTPAQSPFGNVPLLPVGGPSLPSLNPGGAPTPVPVPVPRTGVPRFDVGMNIPAFAPQPTVPRRPAVANGLNGFGPKFAVDEMGRTIKFVPSPRPGEGFLPVAQARALFGSAMKPFWRFNRVTGQFEKMKSRRMNPLNISAARRAKRRVDASLDAVKELVTIQKKAEKGVSAGGKVVKFKVRKRKVK